jgi:hypothetical protein
LFSPFAKSRALAFEICQQFLGLILGHEADELRQLFVFNNRSLRDKAQLLPGSVEPLVGFVVHEQTFEWFILSMEQLEGDDLVIRRDFTVENLGRENGTKICKSFRQIGLRRTVQAHEVGGIDLVVRQLPDSVAVAVTADLLEPPQQSLPAVNHGRDCFRAVCIGFTPHGPDNLEWVGRFRIGQRLPENAQILGIQTFPRCYLLDLDPA